MELIIKESKIHGNGIFTIKEVKKGEIVSVCFKQISDSIVFWERFQETLQGKFTNHSILCNTVMIENTDGLVLKAINDINKDTEITCNYEDLREFIDETGFNNYFNFWDKNEKK